MKKNKKAQQDMADTRLHTGRYGSLGAVLRYVPAELSPDGRPSCEGIASSLLINPTTFWNGTGEKWVFGSWAWSSTALLAMKHGWKGRYSGVTRDRDCMWDYCICCGGCEFGDRARDDEHEMQPMQCCELASFLEPALESVPEGSLASTLAQMAWGEGTSENRRYVAAFDGLRGHDLMRKFISFLRADAYGLVRL